VAHNVEFRPAAQDDLITLYLYIAEQSGRTRASAYIDRIEAACMALATFPERGSVRNDLVPNLRIIGFERRVSIAFIVKGDIVEIQRIFYGGQDYSEEWPG
jgi:toxin ParE1/3/4